MVASIQIAQLLAKRKQARLRKDWQLSDNIRNELDEMGAFIFDQKDGDQRVCIRGPEFFVHMIKAGRLYNLEFKNRRQYVEWRLQQNILAEKRFDAWLFSIQQSEAFQRSRKQQHDIA